MKPISIADRSSKVNLSHQAPTPRPLSRDVLDSFPQVLAAQSLRLLVERIVAAHQAQQPVIFTMGAHPIKCGLTPVLVELMRKGILTGIGTNGASMVHDLELSLFHCTSEDVVPSLKDGTFGVTSETHRIFRQVLRSERPGGLGSVFGDYILSYHRGLHHRSLFACAEYYHIPATVHVTFGADVLHMDPELDAAMLGTRSMEDFWRFRQEIQTLASGGVLINWGSAVTMPEVILKAIGSLRNDGVVFENVTMANFDMNRQYRAQTRIVDVANELGGTGLSITGHHEIMMPLLAGMILGQIEEQP